jgi:hypothetical protein
MLRLDRCLLWNCGDKGYRVTRETRASFCQQPSDGDWNVEGYGTRSNRSVASIWDTDAGRDSRFVQNDPTDGGESVTAERYEIRSSNRPEAHECAAPARQGRQSAKGPQEWRDLRLHGPGHRSQQVESFEFRLPTSQLAPRIRIAVLVKSQPVRHHTPGPSR